MVFRISEGGLLDGLNAQRGGFLVLECSADSVDFDALSLDFAGDDGRSLEWLRLLFCIRGSVL